MSVTVLLKRFALVSAGLILLASCAAPYKKVMARFEESPLCCRGFEEFRYEPLSLPDEKSFRIDEESGAFAFETGKSYFRAFELPPFTAPYSITVKSYLLGDSIKNAYIFRPAVMFLDSRHEMTRLLETGAFAYAKPSLFETSGLRMMYTGEIPVSAENAGDRYMIILTTDRLRAETAIHTSRIFIPFIFPGIVGVLPTGAKETNYVPHAPVGKLRIIVHLPSGEASPK